MSAFVPTRQKIDITINIIVVIRHIIPVLDFEITYDNTKELPIIAKKDDAQVNFISSKYTEIINIPIHKIKLPATAYIIFLIL